MGRFLGSIGDRALDEVHDATLEPFVRQRLEVEKVSLTTVNRSKEVARRILNLAARSWRHENGMTWLETSPLISIDAKQARKKARRPYPLSGEDRIDRSLATPAITLLKLRGAPSRYN